jgi:hypothetical protein
MAAGCPDHVHASILWQLCDPPRSRMSNIQLQPQKNRQPRLEDHHRTALPPHRPTTRWATPTTRSGHQPLILHGIPQPARVAAMARCCRHHRPTHQVKHTNCDGHPGAGSSSVCAHQGPSDCTRQAEGAGVCFALLHPPGQLVPNLDPPAMLSAHTTPPHAGSPLVQGSRANGHRARSPPHETSLAGRIVTGAYLDGGLCSAHHPPVSCAHTQAPGGPQWAAVPAPATPPLTQHRRCQPPVNDPAAGHTARCPHPRPRVA